MQEIEVGEYVRTREKIGKLIRIERDDIDTSLKWYVFDDGKNKRYVNKPYIENHSHNIIDLIEVGDYVNEEKVIETHKDLGYIFVDKETELGTKTFCDYQVESIVTKQQFESIKYKI